jgi:hypothetical protein
MHHNNKWIGNEVSNVLEKEFKAEMKKFNGMKLIDVAKKLKATNKDMKRILSYRGAMDIVHKVSPMLEDIDFLTRRKKLLYTSTKSRLWMCVVVCPITYFSRIWITYPIHTYVGL